MIELEALPLNPKEDHTVEVVDSFFDGLKTIVFEQFNEGTNRELIELFDGNLGKSLKSNMRKMIIHNGKEDCEIYKDIENHLVKYWGGVENKIDSISGILETVNLHSKTKKFHIFPVGINKRVRCIFPKELLNQYRHSYFPFKITVTDIEIYPEEEELPTFV